MPITIAPYWRLHVPDETTSFEFESNALTTRSQGRSAMAVQFAGELGKQAIQGNIAVFYPIDAPSLTAVEPDQILRLDHLLGDAYDSTSESLQTALYQEIAAWLQRHGENTATLSITLSPRWLLTIWGAPPVAHHLDAAQLAAYRACLTPQENIYGCPPLFLGNGLPPLLIDPPGNWGWVSQRAVFDERHPELASSKFYLRPVLLGSWCRRHNHVEGGLAYVHTWTDVRRRKSAAKQAAAPKPPHTIGTLRDFFSNCRLSFTTWLEIVTGTHRISMTGCGSSRFIYIANHWLELYGLMRKWGGDRAVDDHWGGQFKYLFRPIDDPPARKRFFVWLGALHPELAKVLRREYRRYAKSAKEPSR